MRLLKSLLCVVAPTMFTASVALAIPVSDVAPGQLLITEIMANPSTGVDPEGPFEWFEVLNLLPVSVDLEGMIVTGVASSFTVVGSGHVIAPGALFLFAHSADPTLNGGLPTVDYAWGDGSLVIANSNGQLSLRQPDGDLIVSNSWSSTLEGVSLELTSGTAPQFGDGDYFAPTSGVPPQYGPTENRGTPKFLGPSLDVTGVTPFEAPEPATLALLGVGLLGLGLRHRVRA